uniref:SUI1 domain-containing protein n=1 Tax=Panagrolaimus superbus TaxID=310955 RepID=A0A914Y0Z9_9BILA
MYKNIYRRKILSKIGESSADLFGKSSFSIASITTSSGISTNLYICEKQPIFFEERSNGPLYPSIYLAWQTPKSFPTLYIPELAFGYIQNGADLMLPGVIINEKIQLPMIERDSPICISIYSEKHDSIKGPIAVGKCLMSRDEMISSSMKGKGVQILHYYQDALWEYGHRETVPTFDASEILSPVIEQPSESKEDIAENITENTAELNINDQDDVVELPPEDDTKAEATEDAETQEEFLRKAFLYALRYKLPEDIKFPLDVGQFYATYLLKSLPEGRKLDMKKTKYKKFSTFLQQVNETAGDGNWFVTILSKKGIDSITDNAAPLSDSSSTSRSTKPGKVKVAECFTLTEASLQLIKQLLPNCSFKKGDILHQNELSEMVKKYVTEKSLLKNGNKAELDETLQIIVKQFTGGIVPINDISQKLSAHMTKAFLITAPDGRRSLRKTQLPQIVLSTEKRAGNKHVTLVNNLQAFGIDAKEFAQKVQIGSATGATLISQAPNCIGPQVLINGNQINFIIVLLDDYGVQKKFVKGAELGVKDKKKGKK